MKRFALVLMLVLPVLASAQMADPVVWDFEMKKVGQEEYEVRLKARLDNGWYIYSANLPSDDGPIPTSISFSAPENIIVIGEIVEEGKKKEGYDEMFGMNVIKYSTEVTFVQKIKAKEASMVKGSVRYMTCDDHKCLPPKQIPFELQPE